MVCLMKDKSICDTAALIEDMLLNEESFQFIYFQAFNKMITMNPEGEVMDLQGV